MEKSNTISLENINSSNFDILYKYLIKIFELKM